MTLRVGDQSIYMCMNYAFYEGSMEDCGTQEEIFDEIEDSESDDEPPPSSVGLGIKTAEDTLEGKIQVAEESCKKRIKPKKSKVSWCISG